MRSASSPPTRRLQDALGRSLSADAVAVLASENAAYITGTNLAVNGGLHMYA